MWQVVVLSRQCGRWWSGVPGWHAALPHCYLAAWHTADFVAIIYPQVANLRLGRARIFEANILTPVVMPSDWVSQLESVVQADTT